MQRGRAAGPLAKGVLYYNTHLANLPKRAKGHLHAGCSTTQESGCFCFFAGLPSELQRRACVRADTLIRDGNDAGLDLTEGLL